MKKLIEMYGLKEGPFDDLNRQLAGAQSVVRRVPATKAKHTSDTARMQADVDASTSVAKREAIGDEQTVTVELTQKELRMIASWAGEYRENDGATELLDKIQNAQGDGGSSFSMTRMTSRKTPFGGGM